MGFKPSEKVLVALRGVYNLPFNLDDPVAGMRTYFASVFPLFHGPDGVFCSYHFGWRFSLPDKLKRKLIYYW